MTHTRLACLAATAALTLAAPQRPSPTQAPFSAVVRRGGLVFVSGLLPQAPPPASFTTQAAQVLDALQVRLSTDGTTLDRVVSTSVYLADAGDFAALNAVWAKYWPSAPPARTTIVAKLPAPGARIMVSAVAAGRGADRTAVQPKGWASPAGPLSYAVSTGDTLFLSGLVPRRGADNTLVKGDIEAQTNAVFDNAEAILRDAGMTLADVVSSRVFLTDGAMFERMNAAYRTRFPENPPARATVITPLVSPDFLIEITMVAVRGIRRTALVTPAADGSPGKPNPNLSSAVRVGSQLFLSGMLGVLPGSPPDAAGQTAETLNRLERTLTSAGFGWREVTEAVVYVTDMSAAADVMKVFGERTDVRMIAGTIAGTGLVSPEGRVEIMLTASK
jgi:enamine deaminase RidA (YjgF/YER057c/UK114 family)